MKKKLLLLSVLLVIISLIAIGYPHGSDPWFAWLFCDETDKESQWILFSVYRLPEICIALMAGMALSVSGLLLQTLLNNPLAGPSILGLTSGSHLFVALTLMGASAFSQTIIDTSVTVASALGALFFGLLIVAIAARIKSTISLLLVGMMLGTFVSAITSVVILKADPNSIKSFTIWSFGSLQQVNLEQLPMILVVLILGLGAAFGLAKPLNALVLGERQAQVLGVNIKRTKWLILIVVAVLTGLITAFCGPIGFVGLIVPNVVKLLFKTAKHQTLMIASAIGGALVLVFCSLMIRVLEPIIVLPINSLTALLGAPIVILLLLKKIRHA